MVSNLANKNKQDYLSAGACHETGTLTGARGNNPFVRHLPKYGRNLTKCLCSSAWQLHLQELSLRKIILHVKKSLFTKTVTEASNMAKWNKCRTMGDGWKNDDVSRYRHVGTLNHTFLLIDFFEREKERETSICCSTHLLIHWLILVCALPDWGSNLKPWRVRRTLHPAEPGP